MAPLGNGVGAEDNRRVFAAIRPANWYGSGNELARSRWALWSAPCWIDGPDGIVIVDAGRNVTGGQKIADEVSRKGRRVAAILLTHRHPDHVGGLGVLHQKFLDTRSTHRRPPTSGCTTTHSSSTRWPERPIPTTRASVR